MMGNVIFNKWALSQETRTLLNENIKNPDKPAHPHSRISAFVIFLLENFNNMYVAEYAVPGTSVCIYANQIYIAEIKRL